MSEPFQRYIKGGLQHEARKEVPAQPVASSFQEELTSLLNKYSKENASGTPDFILADFLAGCLSVFDNTISNRAHWRSEPVDPPSMQEAREAAKNPKKNVPILMYQGGRRNEVGRALLEVTPGEMAVQGRITSVVPMFENNGVDHSFVQPTTNISDDPPSVEDEALAEGVDTPPSGEVTLEEAQRIDYDG